MPVLNVGGNTVVAPVSVTAPSLQKIFSLCQQKSYFSRTDAEVWDAIDQGGRNCYDVLSRELRGFGRVVDTSSVTLVPGTQTYALPAMCDQVIQISERVLATDQWNPMRGVNSENDDDFVTAGFNTSGALSNFFTDGGSPRFLYYGPYLPASEEQAGTNIQQIDIEPIPTDTRSVRLVYTTKWTTIVNYQSPVSLPMDLFSAMQNFAIGQLLQANGDDLAAAYKADGQQQLTTVLGRLRLRQLQNQPTATPYLGGF